MSRLDRETGKLVRDILALPERERIEAFEALRADLGDAAAPSKVDDLNTQMATAIEIFNKVADHLGFDHDELKLGMKMREFDSAPSSVREGVKARHIRALFGSWHVAAQAAAGDEPLPTSPAQRKRRQRLSARRRKSAHFEQGLTEWLATDPDPASRGSYDRWRKERNENLKDGELPFRGSSQISQTLRRSWADIVSEARAGQLVPATVEGEDLWASRRPDEAVESQPPLEIEPASPAEFEFDPELVARRLQQIRKSRGWTIQDLARRSQVAAENIAGVEDQGRSKVTFGTIVRVAKALGVSIDYFATDDGESGLPPRDHRSYDTSSKSGQTKATRRKRRG